MSSHCADGRLLGYAVGHLLLPFAKRHDAFVHRGLATRRGANRGRIESEEATHPNARQLPGLRPVVDPRTTDLQVSGHVVRVPQTVMVREGRGASEGPRGRANTWVGASSSTDPSTWLMGLLRCSLFRRRVMANVPALSRVLIAPCTIHPAQPSRVQSIGRPLRGRPPSPSRTRAALRACSPTMMLPPAPRTLPWPSSPLPPYPSFGRGRTHSTQPAPALRR